MLCAFQDLLSILFLAAAVAIWVHSVVLQHRFLRRLEKEEPDVWRRLGDRGAVALGGDACYAGAQQFLWTGEYKVLANGTLVSLGHRAQRALRGSVAALIVWVGFALLTQGWPNLACLRQLA